jgi:uncharacterized heparinase superfamily protein
MFNPSLYFHTIRHLRPQQVSHRLLRKINGRGQNLSTPVSVALRPLFIETRWLNKLQSGDGEFTFLSLRKDFQGNSIDWRCPEMPKLWRYNLHYFDYLQNSSRSFESLSLLIDGWIANNPMGSLDAWEPFPVSLRIVNWVKFILGDGGRQARTEWLNSLYQQALWLERNIEYDLLANHLFKNAKALVFVGMFFDGKDSERWLSNGTSIIHDQLRDQILPDGGHFERSPMYHSMILEDCLDLVNICKGNRKPEAQNLLKKATEASQRMMKFLSGVTHADEQIALFNDAAFGIETQPSGIAKYYEQVLGEHPKTPTGCWWAFPDTGYFIMAPWPSDRLIVDCGPIGPDYQPGHSHSDTLSFELSLHGRRVIVDSGCFQYEDGDIRRYNRGNAGHNTVTVDGKNQSEVWGAHRCGRRAYPLYARLNGQENGAVVFEGAHDGYKRLKGRPIHHRRIAWDGGQITIDDRIEGQGTHDIESRLHIHPDLRVAASENKVQVCEQGKQLMTVEAIEKGGIEIENGWYCPEFNKKINCPVISLKVKNTSLPSNFGWKLKMEQGS